MDKVRKPNISEILCSLPNLLTFIFSQTYRILWIWCQVEMDGEKEGDSCVYVCMFVCNVFSNSTLSLFYTFCSSPLHTHKNSQSLLVVSRQRISQQSQCNFKLHMKSSCHSLIHFLPFLFNHLRMLSPELGSILDYSASTASSDLLSLFTNPRHWLHGKHSLYC
jgi:hypothetical protein